jgi:hypothetical protein
MNQNYGDMLQFLQQILGNKMSQQQQVLNTLPGNRPTSWYETLARQMQAQDQRQGATAPRSYSDYLGQAEITN